jgi:hypothetical protein
LSSFDGRHARAVVMTARFRFDTALCRHPLGVAKDLKGPNNPTPVAKHLDAKR